MGCGVSSGGGQSSLGYLFGTNEAPKPAAVNSTPAIANSTAPVEKPSGSSPAADGSKQTPAGIQGNPTNNHFRADGQNTGNFITERPSTKVHSASGGGSSLGYLFGDGGK